MKFLTMWFRWFFDIKHQEPVIKIEELDAFQIECNRRKEKHKNTLHPVASGCRVHLAWDDKQECELLSHLKGSSTLFELSGLTGRPIWGIADRLKKLGLVATRGRYYYINERLDRIPHRIERTLSSRVIRTLIEKGWYYEQRIGSNGINKNILMAPRWWLSHNCLQKGNKNGTL